MAARRAHLRLLMAPAAGFMAALGAGTACSLSWPAGPAAPLDSPAGAVPPSATPPRPFLLVELIREARTAPGTRPDTVSACLWHVNAQGVLYGDHWGWCEDYMLLPAESPGYLLATTEYSGGTSGGYGALRVLPGLPTTLAVFGHPLRLEHSSGTPPQITLDFREQRFTLRPGERRALGREQALVEAPLDTGHFEPGGDQPVTAEVSYVAVFHGWLDARNVAGRGAIAASASNR